MPEMPALPGAYPRADAASSIEHETRLMEHIVKDGFFTSLYCVRLSDRPLRFQELPGRITMLAEDKHSMVLDGAIDLVARKWIIDEADPVVWFYGPILTGISAQPRRCLDLGGGAAVAIESPGEDELLRIMLPERMLVYRRMDSYPGCPHAIEFRWPD
jgi:hypothetical protein